MSKPGIAYTWDSGSVNLVAPTGGHQASGFASNEIPASSEVNGAWKNFGDWTTWLNTHGVARYNWRTPVGTSMTGTYTPSSAGLVVMTNGQVSNGIPLDRLGVGQTIDRVAVSYTNPTGSFTSPTVTLNCSAPSPARRSSRS